MSDNIANTTAHAVGGFTFHSQVGPETQPEQDSGATQGTEETTTTVNLTQTSASTVPINAFHIVVGPAGRQYTLDINDLRRESDIFRSSTIITSIELRREDPAAVELIVKWFSGNVGPPPVTRAARNLFVDAANIARQLHLTECESQLMVIVHKTTTTLANIFWDQLETATVLSTEQVADLVTSDMTGYLTRSINVGGEEGSDDGFDPENLI